MFCTGCGTKVVEGSSHCTACGARVDGVGVAAAMVSNVAMSAYANMGQDFKRSLFLGGGSMFLSLLMIPLAGSAGALLLILLVPATMILAILGLNAGRDLPNKAGYYLGMIGLVSSTLTLYLSIFAYVAKSIAQSAASSMMGGMMGM